MLKIAFEKFLAPRRYPDRNHYCLLLVTRLTRPKNFIRIRPILFRRLLHAAGSPKCFQRRTFGIAKTWLFYRSEVLPVAQPTASKHRM